MNISKVDKNFTTSVVNKENLAWHSVLSQPFCVYGVAYDKEYQGFLRLPKSVAKATSVSVDVLSECTAGGRIRFKTNSSFVAVKCFGSTTMNIMHHMPISGTFGVAFYVDGIFNGHVCPTAQQVINPQDGKICFDGFKSLDSKMHEIELCLPLYNGMKEIYIGLEDGCTILPPEPYKHQGYVLFYGTSITQGGCASHSGNDYVNMLSRMLSTDVLNLGMSGSGRAEKPIVDYIASLSPSIFVIDYHANAPSLESLKETHLPFYRTIREKHKDTPIIFLTQPIKKNQASTLEGKKIIYETYQTSLREGDKNTAYIDGNTLFGEEYENYCTMDTIHPNDLGFHRMAVNIAPTIKKFLK